MTTTAVPVHPQPPLRFDPFDPAVVRSPWAVHERLRDEAPVLAVPYASLPGHRHVPARTGHDHFYVLSRFADVFAAARDVETYSSAHGLSIDGGDKAALGLAPTIVMMDQPEHTAYRRLVARGFTPRKVSELEPELRAFVRGRVDRLADLLSNGGEADLVPTVAGPVPSFVVASYLGVPPADRELFDGWSESIVSANAAGDVLGGAQEAVGELYGYFTELIEHRRARPGDDMISTLVAATLHGEPVDLPSILGYAFVMIAGGNDTATGLIAGGVEALTCCPDQRALLAADPALVPNAVEELLRWTSPVQGLARQTLRPVTVHGTEIPVGARVHLLYGSANRDPREFGPTADRLDVRRAIAKILTFTSGPHYCLGAAAARLQGRVVFEELLARFPRLEADPDRGTYAPGAFVRRHASLPVRAEAA